MAHICVLVILFCVVVCNAAGPNIPCMLMNCFDQSKNCMEDHNCRSALFCITECGESNQTCMFRCLYSYEDKIFDDFMKCVSTDHNCITLEPPNPPVVCRPPPTYVKDFTLDHLNGSWYIVMGKNPLYDCFDCQITSFHPISSPSIYIMYRVNEKFDVHAIQGGIVHREVNETVEQTDPDKGGLLNYTSSQMGHKASSQWRILDYAVMVTISWPTIVGGLPRTGSLKVPWFIQEHPHWLIKIYKLFKPPVPNSGSISTPIVNQKHQVVFKNR
ncbi:hypothetical protein KUTeg_011027 [Tegillarca granosa]|uniref:VDE lipocalin domain-containing protein n=1 Tax=Tegillarca granosa TaxID=220873 RepID=A0ABQ9F5X2_TEGGR|nr:hypothetical protein KUTeg_011027 [Tegillarca granosa]